MGGHENMVKISIILPTAREDYPMVGLPETHLFEPTLRSLAAQQFKDFELVVVDALYEKRRGYFERNRTDFPVLHIPPKANPWRARRMWMVSTQFNTGLMHARGELIVTIGDCSELPVDLLGRFWELYQKGYLAQAMVRYHKGGRQTVNDGQDVDPTKPAAKWARLFNIGEPVVDTRFRFVEAEGGQSVGRMPQWWYGYGAAPLEAYLAVNGFDEALDGGRQQDCDLGSRFEMAGHSRLLLATDLSVIEHAHDFVSAEVFDRSAKQFKCNHAIYLWNRKARRFRANTGPFSKEALDFIKQTTRSSVCSHTGGADYDLWEGFDWWAANIPKFDLKEERKRLLGETETGGLGNGR